MKNEKIKTRNKRNRIKSHCKNNIKVLVILITKSKSPIVCVIMYYQTVISVSPFLNLKYMDIMDLKM